MEEYPCENCIRTVSGLYVDIKHPTAETIIVNDIAHALSKQCRFGGHLKRFYSVAQHSVMASRAAKTKEDRFALLMHDAAEYIFLDMPTPIKNLIPEYKALEKNLMRVIAEKYQLEYPMHPGIKEVDTEMYFFERRHVVARTPLKGFKIWSQKKAKREFLREFGKLYTAHKQSLLEVKN